MKITALETIQLAEFPNLLFLRLHTDEELIGRDPGRIEALRYALKHYVGTKGTGVECRANSAVDIALWDLLGKAVNRPIYALLGGAFQDSVRVYNTCAGYYYVRGATGQARENWGVGDSSGDQAKPPVAQPEAASDAPGPYEDLQAWLHGGAGDLAQSLLEQGITGMKMWPFDEYAYATNGTGGPAGAITAAELDRGLEP